MVTKENKDIEGMDDVHVKILSEKTLTYRRESDVVYVRNESLNNQVVRIMPIESDRYKANANERDLSNVQLQTMMILRDGHVQEEDNYTQESDIRIAQNYTSNERKDSFDRKEHTDNIGNSYIKRAPVANVDTTANRSASYVQNETISRLRGKLFLFYETNTSYGNFLQESIQILGNDSQNNRYGNTRVPNSLSENNRSETSSVDEATLIPIQQLRRQVLIYSAILSNSSQNTTWDRLAIQGWEMVNLTNQSYLCCVLYKYGIIRVVQVSVKIKRRFEVQLKAKQFICNLSNDLQKELPVSVTMISDGQGRCPTRDNMYKRIEYAYEHPGEFVIFAKIKQRWTRPLQIIYGNISTTDLLAWLEFHRWMGADKVVFYPFRLGQNVTKVLQYHQALGFVETVPFAFPTKDFYEEDLELVNSGFPFFNHQDVAIMDGLERLQGYKYMASFDTDEYLTPAYNETLVSLFDRLCMKYPDAAGFTFGTYIYITNWGPAWNESVFTIGTYLNRTVLTRDRNKHVVLPKRVSPGLFFTHSFFPREPFQRYRVRESDAAIRHYRGCRKHYMGSKSTCSQFKAYKDDYLYKTFKPLEKRVLRLKRQLGV